MSMPLTLSTMGAFTNGHMGGWGWLVIVNERMDAIVASDDQAG
jgi:hypothetical protein